LCGLVGLGVGTTPRPGLVRVGVGVAVAARFGWDEASGAEASPVGSVVLPTALGGAAADVTAGTTRTSGRAVPVVDGLGAVTIPIEVGRAEVVSTASGPGSTPGPPPSAQAMPAEPTTAAAPSATTGP